MIFVICIAITLGICLAISIVLNCGYSRICNSYSKICARYSEACKLNNQNINELIEENEYLDKKLRKMEAKYKKMVRTFGNPPEEDEK